MPACAAAGILHIPVSACAVGNPGRGTSEEEIEPFIALCVRGKARPAAISDFIEAWNRTDPMWREPLHEFLGMDKPEFALWVRVPDTLAFIVKARREKAALIGIVKDGYRQLRTAGGAKDRSKIALLRNWLSEQGQRRWLREQGRPSAPAGKDTAPAG